MSATTVAGLIACWKDPVDPNVHRFREVRSLATDSVIVDPFVENVSTNVNKVHAMRRPRNHSLRQCAGPFVE